MKEASQNCRKLRPFTPGAKPRCPDLKACDSTHCAERHVTQRLLQGHLQALTCLRSRSRSSRPVTGNTNISWLYTSRKGSGGSTSLPKRRLLQHRVQRELFGLHEPQDLTKKD